MIGSKYQNRKTLSNLDEKKWDILTFNDVFIDDTRKATKVKKEDYLETGDFPIVDQGKDYITGYTNLKEEVYDNTPLIIFGDHTRILKYIDFPIFIGADGVKLLKNRFSEKEVLTKYLYYYLCTINIPDTGYNRHFKYLKEIVIPIPDIEMQKRIVQILDKAQELIDKRKAQIEALDQLTQSVFLEMFGDPINTKWKTEKLSEITDVRDGTHDSPKYIQKGYPLVTSKNIKDGEIDLTNVNYISEEDYEKINQRSKVDIGDIIMPMIGTIGNPVIVNVEPNFAIKNVALIKFYPDTCIINIYLKYLLDSHYLDFVLSKNRRGGTQKFLSLKNIRNMEIPVPPIKLQKDFTKVIREINEKKKLLNKSLDEMVNAYNSIMQRAFKGELFTEDKVPNH
ncbi:restriction endonuclease subunit S [Pallidibacillus pasinlerensis]|uniref:Restriction endonuclease subunit S n=1 Tax=Pallidibacillus pasinlerensis TaxID=2703818 RepID=A0ABX0A1A6_9BACI|nr:restriction endonuclease subunit S [Pallidibacillus pasinlerensis]NCU16607.1 restriction endonuclease subunit S [Pallidibacillus pasinlerensis]